MELKTAGLSYAADGRKLLQDISLTVSAGEAVGIWGASGAGKTTLLLALRGVLQHYSMGRLQGTVLLDEKPVQDYPYEHLGASIALLFQDIDRQLFSATVWDEVAFGLENLCMPPAEIRQRTEAVLEELGLISMAQSSPRCLSGGQRKLVALASLLVLRPRVLLLDEPLASLDAGERRRILIIFQKLKEQGMALVLAGHDWEAAELLDRMLFLSVGRVAAEKKKTEFLSDPELLAQCGLLPPPLAVFLQAMGWQADDMFHMEQVWQKMEEDGYLA